MVRVAKLRIEKEPTPVLILAQAVVLSISKAKRKIAKLE